MPTDVINMHVSQRLATDDHTFSTPIHWFTMINSKSSPGFGSQATTMASSTDSKLLALPACHCYI